jgi:hypothetical protein
MGEPADRFDFVAVLVFNVGRGRRTIEPHVFRATHPEVAYRCALAKGREERHVREFVGLADLAETAEEVSPIGKTEGGEAIDLVTPKSLLSAFRDARWIGSPHDPAEVEAALREPPPLVELTDVDKVDWDRTSHAYGPAVDVPIDLRRLASSDEEVRANALWELGGSIFHQGDIFNSTALAVPFLVVLAASPVLPNRIEILDFLAEIAASAAATDAESIRTVWAKRQALLPQVAFARTAAEMAEAQIAAGLAVQASLDAATDALGHLRDEANSAVGTAAARVLDAMRRQTGRPRRPA